MPLNIGYLIVEATRRCNLRCEHCCRGPIEHADLDPRVVQALACDPGLDSIGELTITGGEPTLNPGALTEFVRVFKASPVEIQNFYIAVNGTQAPDEFILAALELHLLCTDNEASAIEISDTVWHDGHQDKTEMEKLKLLSFTRMRSRVDPHADLANKWAIDCDGSGKPYSGLILEGRARKWVKENGFSGRAAHVTALEPREMREYNATGDAYIYVAVNGDVILGCDLSYKSQRKARIGNVLAEPLSAILWREVEREEAEVEREKAASTAGAGHEERQFYPERVKLLVNGEEVEVR